MVCCWSVDSSHNGVYMAWRHHVPLFSRQTELTQVLCVLSVTLRDRLMRQIKIETCNAVFSLQRSESQRHQMETLSRYWPFVREFTGHRWIPLTKASDAGALMFSLIRAWPNVWVNNRDTGDLTCHRTHNDVTSMRCGDHMIARMFWDKT